MTRVGTELRWQFYFHVSMGNLEQVRVCIDNGLYERENIKYRPYIELLAGVNGHLEVVNLLRSKLPSLNGLAGLWSIEEWRQTETGDVIWDSCETFSTYYQDGGQYAQAIRSFGYRPTGRSLRPIGATIGDALQMMGVSMDEVIDRRKAHAQPHPNLKLLKSGILADVTIYVGNPQSHEFKCFRLHKAVLAAQSPYFERLFTAAMQEAKSDSDLDFSGFCPRVFEKMTQFIYCNVQPSPQDTDFAELFRCADYFQVEPLMLLCLKYFAQNISQDNFVQLVGASFQLDNSSIFASCVHFFLNHCDEILSKPEFWSLERNILIPPLPKRQTILKHNIFLFKTLKA